MTARLHVDASRIGPLVAVVTLATLAAVLVGCGPTPQERYETTLAILREERAELELLRPAYEDARGAATEAVCKELTGHTPDEAAAYALGQVNAAMASGLADSDSGESTAEYAERMRRLNATLKEQKDTWTAPLDQVTQVVANMDKPGTREAKRFDEVLATMPDAQIYDRQAARVDRAIKNADAAEAALK